MFVINRCQFWYINIKKLSSLNKSHTSEKEHEKSNALKVKTRKNERDSYVIFRCLFEKMGKPNREDIIWHTKSECRTRKKDEIGKMSWNIYMFAKCEHEMRNAWIFYTEQVSHFIFSPIFDMTLYILGLVWVCVCVILLSVIIVIIRREAKTDSALCFTLFAMVSNVHHVPSMK